MKIRRDQESLPIHSYKSAIVTAVQSHQVVIVAGDTGCGKSTQVRDRGTPCVVEFGNTHCDEPV